MIKPARPSSADARLAAPMRETPEPGSAQEALESVSGEATSAPVSRRSESERDAGNTPPRVTPAAAAEPSAPRGWKRWIRPVLLVVSAAFVVLTAFDLSRRWEGEVRVDPVYALGALLAVCVGNVVQGIGWILLVERMAARSTPRRIALALYLDSQLARYAPGKVALALVRMEGAPRIGLSRGIVGVSVFVEALSWLATGSIVGLGVLVLTGAPSEGLGKLAGPWLVPMLLAALAGGAVLVSVDRRRLPRSVLARLRLEGAGPIVPLRLPIAQGVYWLTWAVHGYLLARALGATSPDAARIMGFIPLAAVLGMASVAAPAGLGVREAVLAYGLAPALGGPGALAAAVLSRAESLVADVLVWLLLRGLARRAAPLPAGAVIPPEP